MPEKDNNILKHPPGQKSLELPFIKYVDLECLLQKTDTCQYNPENPYKKNKALRVPSGYSLVTCCSYDKSKTESKYYRGKDCIEKLCKYIRDQATKIINYKKKMEILLTDEEKSFHERQRYCHICKKSFVIMKMMKICFKKL